MNLEKHLQAETAKALTHILGLEITAESIKIQPTRKEFEGSHTVAVFQYSKTAQKSPEDFGQDLGTQLQKQSTMIDKFNIVKGFLNITFNHQAWLQVMQEYSQNFNPKPTKNIKIMVEYSSPNTNKPLHLGHLRNIFLGDSLSKILSFNGYEVIKANLVNDRGIHICKSMLAYQKNGNGVTPDILGIKGDRLVGDFYVNFNTIYSQEIKELMATGLSEEEAIKKSTFLKEAQEMLLKWEQNDADTVALWSRMNSWVYDGFAKTYAQIGVEFDQYYYESNTYLLGKKTVADGLAKGVFFQKEDNSVWIDLSAEGLDQKLLLRGDGTSVYITQDLGTADLKYTDHHVDRSIYVVGNEQDYHFKVLKCIIEKLDRPYAKGVYHLSYGMVDLPTGKMKSREGTVVDADDIVQEMIDTAKERTLELGKTDGMPEDEAQKLYQMLGLAALKYFLLKVDPQKRMMFNPEDSIDFQGNTGPFIQYTHARISALVRKANQMNIEIATPNLENLSLEPCEIELLRILHDFDIKIDESANAYSPALLANYVYELAKEYNHFYSQVSVFGAESAEKIQMRVYLSYITAKIINISMKMLGIEVPEKM